MQKLICALLVILAICSLYSWLSWSFFDHYWWISTNGDKDARSVGIAFAHVFGLLGFLGLFGLIPQKGKRT